MLFAGPVEFDIPPELVLPGLAIAACVALVLTIPAGLPMARAARTRGHAGSGAYLGGVALAVTTAIVGDALLRGAGAEPSADLLVLAYVPGWALALFLRRSPERDGT